MQDAAKPLDLSKGGISTLNNIVLLSCPCPWPPWPEPPQWCCITSSMASWDQNRRRCRRCSQRSHAAASVQHLLLLLLLQLQLLLVLPVPHLADQREALDNLARAGPVLGLWLPTLLDEGGQLSGAERRVAGQLRPLVLEDDVVDDGKVIEAIPMHTSRRQARRGASAWHSVMWQHSTAWSISMHRVGRQHSSARLFNTT